jgi:pyridoxal phosphate enzyme (YggS family)
MNESENRPPVDIAANLRQVREAIAAAVRKAGREPDSVRLLPVSKTVSVEGIRVAIAAGERRFGENKVQEAAGKSEALADESLDWVIIGHLQTNKVKEVVRFAGEVQSLDRLKLAETLERRLQSEGRAMDVLVQVNTSEEASKYGLRPEEVADFFKELKNFETLRVRGLMTLALFSSDPVRVRACFRRLRVLRDQLREADNDLELTELSMGMSGDYELAIEEGSTEVRIGQAIFGPRALPDSYYWPTG